MRYSRIVDSCAPVRFLMIDNARRTRADRLEIAQQDHGVRKIRHVDRRLHVADQSMLRDRHEGRRPLAIEILQQLVHVQNQRILLGHRRLIAIEAVDQHGLDVVLVNPLADAMGEFAGRKLGGIDLLDKKIAAALHRFEIDAKTFHAVKQEAQLFIENKEGGLLAPRHRGDEENDGEQRFAGARRPQDQRARTRTRCRRPAVGPVRRYRSTSARLA